MDTKKVVESWRMLPFLSERYIHNTNSKNTAKDNPDGVPTPRAIAERLHKIRNDAKGKGAEFSISGGKGSPSTQSTPRKGGQKAAPKTPTSKRKRGDDKPLKDECQDNSDAKLEEALETPSAKRTLVKNEQKDDEFTPRAKREVSVSTPRLGLIPFHGFADETEAPEANTSGSEYSPGEADEEFEDENMA